jgi:hypothetical protein
VVRRPVVTGGVPREWGEFARQRKTIVGWPEWSDPPPLPDPRKAATSRTELHSLSAEITETLIPLADSSGVGLEGVRLRINAWAYRRMHEVTATLEVPGHRKLVTIARVDAWPIDPHFNIVRQRPALKYLPAVIDGSHVHRFEDNARLGLSAFAPYSNLPAAMPTRTLTSFRVFLRTVGSYRRILVTSEVRRQRLELAI